MNEIIQSIIIGIVQGVTELLPISSSGHLILITNLFDQDPSQHLLTFLHLASAIALTIIYLPKILEKLSKSDRTCFVCNILIALIPAIFVGVFLGDSIEELLYSPKFVAFSLLLWGLIMIITERFEKKGVKQTEGDVNKKNAISMGLAQTLALIPGTSRSGITTMAGMWSGVEKSTALDFSFMLGIPLLYGAFAYSFVSDSESFFKEFEIEWIFSFLAALIFSYIAAIYLRKFSKRRFLTFFGIYRVILGMILLLLII